MDGIAARGLGSCGEVPGLSKAALPNMWQRSQALTRMQSGTPKLFLILSNNLMPNKSLVYSDIPAAVLGMHILGGVKSDGRRPFRRI